jgi:hypothetical protein
MIMKSFRFNLALLAVALIAFAPSLAIAQSTINTNLPASNSSMTSLVMRQQFLAAASDINSIIGMHAASTLSGCPSSPVLGEDCLVGNSVWYKWAGSSWSEFAVNAYPNGPFSVALNSGNLSATAPVAANFTDVPGVISLSYDSNFATVSNALALQSGNANKILATPNGSSGEPTLRALVGADLPTPGASSLGGVESYTAPTHQLINEISTTGSVNSVQLNVSDLAGLPVDVGQGGTGQQSLTANAFLTGNGTSGINQVAITGIVVGNGGSAPTAYGGCSVVTNEVITALSASGACTQAQLVFSNISGTASAAQGGTGSNNSSANGVGQWASGSYSTSPILANGTEATTQSESDASIDLATDAFVAGITSLSHLTTATSLAIAGSQITSGTVSASYLPQATNSAYGIVEPDGTTTEISGGKLVAIGAAATAVAIDTTTVTGGTNFDVIGITNSGCSSTIPCMTNISPSTTVAGQTCLLGASCGLTSLTDSLGANVSLSSTSVYADGPSVAQGTSGTWFASGQVVVADTGTTQNMYCKLWDGTNVISSAGAVEPAAGFKVTIALSGILSSPAGNIRISCLDIGGTGLIYYDWTGNSKDSTVTAVRIS